MPTSSLRLGYFGEAQPFLAGCARGWFNENTTKVRVTCLHQSTGPLVLSKLDSRQLDTAVLGSTPLASAISRGVDIETVYLTHSKGRSQGLVVREGLGIVSPWDLKPHHIIATPFGSTAHYHMQVCESVCDIQVWQG